jgi:type 1 glutamine amidotransferase
MLRRLSTARQVPDHLSCRRVRSTARAVQVLVALLLGSAHVSSGAGPSAHAKVRLLVLGGGLQTTHQFAANSGVWLDRLRLAQTAECTYTESLDALREENLQRYDALLIYAWRAREHGGSIETRAQKDGLLQFLRRGGGLMVAHIGVGCFDDWDEFGRLVGRVWVTGRSGHTAYKPFTVRIRDGSHPTLRGLRDFETTDELYQGLIVRTDLPAIATAREGNQDEPMVWTNTFGQGRIFVTTLGHGPESWRDEDFLKMLTQSLLWVARRSG